MTLRTMSRSIREQTAEGHSIVDDDDTQPASIDLHLNRETASESWCEPTPVSIT